MKERNVEVALALSIIAVGVVIRLIPNIIYFAWGNDYGIYYYLSQAFLTGKSIVYPPNSPWGNDGYQFFPVTYFIVLGVHYLFRVPLNVALNYSIPFLGGLTPFLLYLISKQLGFNRYVSVLAGFLLAVNPVQVYQTSQPNYLTTGHFFLLLTILFFFKFHKDRKYLVPLVISLALLIMSHQLSTYIFLISIAGIVIFVNLLSDKWKSYLLWDTLFIESTGTFMMLYLLLRIPSMVHFFSGAMLGIGYGGVMVLFYVSTMLIYIVLSRWKTERFSKHLNSFLIRFKLNIDPGRDFYLTIISTLAIMLVFVVGMITGLLPSYISFNSIFISIPFFLFLSISIVGLKYFLTEMNIAEVFGWSFTIAVSLLYSVISRNTVLLPARYFEYLAAPFSIIAAYVLYKWDIHYKETHKLKNLHGANQQLMIRVPMKNSNKSHSHKSVAKPSFEGMKRYVVAKRFAAENIVIIVALSLILLMGVVSYPMTSDYIPSHTEAITYQDEAAIQYLNQTGNRNLSVATDHQIGIYIESFGFSSPFNNLSIFWNSTNWTQAIWQIIGENGTYLPVGYVLISSYMIEYGVWGYNGSNNPNQPPVYLNESSFSKFFTEPMELMYENTSATQNVSSYLFGINWTYVNSYLSQRGLGNLSYYVSLYHEKNRNDTSSPPEAVQASEAGSLQNHPAGQFEFLNSLPRRFKS